MAENYDMNGQTVQWNDLNERDRDEVYGLAVQQTFGVGNTHPVVVDALLRPPMRSLESFQIAITTHCNLSCQQCIRTKGIADGTWISSHMPLESFRTIIQKMPRTKRVVLQGTGEPSMHPQFRELVQLASETGKCDFVSFNTNGHSRDDAFWVDLCRRYPLAIQLSVDSLDPDVATLCRAGTNVATLYHRILLFKAVCKNFAVSMVVSRLNRDDIPQTLRKLAELGIRTYMQGVITEEAGLALDENELRELSRQKDDIRREFPDFIVGGAEMAGMGRAPTSNRCIRPFTMPYVTLRGELTPCCIAHDPGHYKTSLLGPSDWNTIRSNPGVMDWISSYIAEDAAPCRSCSLNPQRKDEQQHKRYVLNSTEYAASEYAG